MIASWTQSQPNLAATSTGKQIAGISVLNHEDHCLLHVMMSTSVLMTVIDRSRKVVQQLLFLGVVRSWWHFAQQLHQASWGFHLLELTEYRRRLVLKHQLVLELFVHDLFDEFEASSIIVFRYAKPDLLHEIERHRTIHNDVAAVCNPSLHPNKVHGWNVENGHWHHMVSSATHPLSCCGVSRIPWGKDTVVAVKSPCIVP